MHAELASLAVAPGGDLLVVGARGCVRRWDGARWTIEQLDDGVTLDAVWAAAADDVWVGAHRTVGPRRPGLFRRRDGVWTPYESPEVRAIWGASATEAWAAGWGAGELFAWDGVAWSRCTGVEARIRRVFGRAADDVWAAGEDDDGGCVLHWDGRRWRRVASEPTARFGDVGSIGVGEAWVVDRSLGRLAKVTLDGWGFEPAPFDVASIAQLPDALVVGGAGQIAFLEGGRFRREVLAEGDLTFETDAEGHVWSVGPCFVEGVAASHGALWAIGNALTHAMESTGEGLVSFLFRRAAARWEAVPIPRR